MRVIIVILSLVFAKMAFADYGSSAVEVNCNIASGEFSVKPHYKWNDEYYNFYKNHPKGYTSNITKGIFLVDSIKDGQATYDCNLSDKKFTLSLQASGQLKVVDESDNVIYKKYDIWFAKNDIYGQTNLGQKYNFTIDSSGSITECLEKRGTELTCQAKIHNEVR